MTDTTTAHCPRCGGTYTAVRGQNPLAGHMCRPEQEAVNAIQLGADPGKANELINDLAWAKPYTEQPPPFPPGTWNDQP